ncbi:hypothetical protein [Insulibacter thermoxylanivorax]|uniref:hypothetical protein n=1 Tax=Insulibacter thermoxylanivorax TaxID=2749268 RepID=UPI00190FCF9F|nr:hypothetical protein [Insulibacter thermoxylanivorax]
MQISIYPLEELAFEYVLDTQELIQLDGGLHVRKFTFDLLSDAVIQDHRGESSIEWIGARVDLQADRDEPYDIEHDFKDHIQILGPSEEPLPLYDSVRADQIHSFSRSTIFEDVYKRYGRHWQQAKVDLSYDEQLSNHMIGFILSAVISNAPGSEPMYKLKVEYNVE